MISGISSLSGHPDHDSGTGRRGEKGKILPLLHTPGAERDKRRRPRRSLAEPGLNLTCVRVYVYILGQPLISPLYLYYYCDRKGRIVWPIEQPIKTIDTADQPQRRLVPATRGPSLFFLSHSFCTQLPYSSSCSLFIFLFATLFTHSASVYSCFVSRQDGERERGKMLIRTTRPLIGRE